MSVGEGVSDAIFGAVTSTGDRLGGNEGPELKSDKYRPRPEAGVMVVERELKLERSLCTGGTSA